MKIKNIKLVKPRKVYAVTTSTATFIADGLAHHNCYNCNINLGGNQYAYGVKLGKEKVDELYTIKNQINKWTEQDYLQRIEHYTRAVDNLRLQQ